MDEPDCECGDAADEHFTSGECQAVHRDGDREHQCPCLDYTPDP